MKYPSITLEVEELSLPDGYDDTVLLQYLEQVKPDLIAFRDEVVYTEWLQAGALMDLSRW